MTFLQGGPKFEVTPLKTAKSTTNIFHGLAVSAFYSFDVRNSVDKHSYTDTVRLLQNF